MSTPHNAAAPAGPLQGVRVLDLSHVIAGPLASFYLAQMGAQVIKIESPLGGDVLRSSKPGRGPGPAEGFVALNAGKRSLALDIRQPQGAALLRQLAATADVFIENFRPGVVAKYGLDEAAIRAVRADIIYCSISGYGQQGPWSTRAAYDHVIQAMTGMMMMSGSQPDDPPQKVGFPVIDVAAGLLSAMAVLGALHRRAKTGQGECIDASMTQAALMLMYPHATSFLTHGIAPQRVGNRGYTGSPTADTYRCRNGWLAVAANTAAQFRLLAQLLGLQDLCLDPQALDLDAFNAPGGGFVVARKPSYVQERFHAAFATLCAFEMEERLNTLGVPCARVRRLDEFLLEATQAHNSSLPVRSYAATEATVRAPGLGFRSSFGAETADTAPHNTAPAHGQDSDAVLSELGYSADAIAHWRAQGIVL